MVAKIIEKKKKSIETNNYLSVFKKYLWEFIFLKYQFLKMFPKQITSIRVRNKTPKKMIKLSLLNLGQKKCFTNNEVLSWQQQFSFFFLLKKGNSEPSG